MSDSDKKQADKQTLPSTHGYLAAKEISVGKVIHIRTCHRQQKATLLRLALTQKQGRLLWSLKSSAARSKKRKVYRIEKDKNPKAKGREDNLS